MYNPFKFLKSEASKMRKPIILALMGLFLALSIIFTRVLRPVELPFLRISFMFLSTALCSILLGPFLGGINAALADLIGIFLFPSPGAAFFPGFSLSALITGVIYGIFLYNKPVTILRVTLAVLTVTIFVDLTLNTIWLSILLNKAWTVILPLRAIKSALWLPVQVLFIHYIWKYVKKNVNFINSL